MKVFISSTYKDLVDYRKAAISAVERSTYQATKMEVFGARPEEPVTACLKEVEQCDMMIGVYALRYGFIPENANISITEMEYLHAKKLGKPILCFILDEENQPWLKKWIEGEPGKSRLENFKKRIRKDHTCDYFTTPDNLEAKIATAISRLAVSFREHEPPPATVHSPSPRSSTLPQQPYFFGRVIELKIIAAALAPDTRAWGALIDGPGGIGKTALAIKAAHDAPADLFDRKIFITAKVRELTPDGEKKLTDFTRPTYLAMLDELGKELGEELFRLSPEDRPNALRLALAGKRALIIFDNLETLPEDERTRLFQFLSRLPDGNKAIVTSRRRTDVDVRIVRLDRLLHDEAIQLIDTLAVRYRRLQQTDQKERDDLYGITHGNPLLIHWIAGQLGRPGSQCRTIAECCDFIAKAPEGNNPLEYIFGDLLDTFTEHETKILAALTHFTLPATLKWLVQMTGLSERVAETALEDLTDRAILFSDPEAHTYILPPLAAEFIRTRRPDAVAKTGDTLVDTVYALAVQYGGFDNYDGFRILDSEWNLIAAALPRLLTGDNSRLQTVCVNLFKFFYFSGRWDDGLWLSERAETYAIAADDKVNAGFRAHDAGWIYNLRNTPADLLVCAVRASEHFKTSTSTNKASATRLRGLGHRLNGDYPTAITAFREVLELHRSISPESENVAICLNDIANTELRNGDDSSAERDFCEALRIAKKVNYQEGVATYTGNLAILALSRKQWVEAETLAREALIIAQKVGRQSSIASNYSYIAEALLNQNRNLSEAVSFANRAVEIFTRLKSPSLQWARDILEQLERVLAK